MNGITSLGEWCDGHGPSVSLTLWSLQFHCYCSFHDIYMFLRLAMRLCNSRIPEEYLVCYQTSQRNWMIIKMLYRYLQRYLLVGIDRDYDLSLRVSDRYLWALSVMHITMSLARNVTNELVAGWCITEQVKRLYGNEIELGIEIPTIGSRASNIPMTKGTSYVVMRSDR